MGFDIDILQFLSPFPSRNVKYQDSTEKPQPANYAIEEVDLTAKPSGVPIGLDRVIADTVFVNATSAPIIDAIQMMFIFILMRISVNRHTF